MAHILDLFNQKEVLNYLKDREYPEMLGDKLFPSIKKPVLEFDMIKGAGKTPIIASVHGFDTEAEIGSREAQKMAMELALIKRKMQLTEKDIIALENPRNEAEQKYLMKEVYNDIDVLVASIEARIEAMRMEILANGTVTLKENNMNAVLDYGVPAENKEVLTDKTWDNPESDPIMDMLRFKNKLGTNPKTALTSDAILFTLLTHPKVKAALLGGDSARIPTIVELNTYLEQLGLPTIVTYNEQYRKENTKTGKVEQHRYFPEDKFVMLPDGELGHTIFGPTAEETRLMRNPEIQASMIGNVLAMVYEENLDPVSTWTKAVATALPSFPYGDEVFQAKVLKNKAVEG